MYQISMIINILLYYYAYNKTANSELIFVPFKNRHLCLFLKFIILNVLALMLPHIHGKYYEPIPIHLLISALHY